MESRKRLLTVDDSEAEREIMAITLAAAFPDAEVHCISDPSLVPQICADNSFDCVLLDYNMPEMDGLTLANRLREADAYLPIILVTSVGDEMLVAEALHGGVSDYITKARVNTDTIRRIVDRSIHASSQARMIDEQRHELEKLAAALARDIKRRMVVERKLRASEAKSEQALAEAENANRAKTEFLAVMSHEIRTPLTSISGFVDLLSRTGNLRSEQIRYLDLVRTANSALLTIVNDILDFSKVETGRFELETRPFALIKLVSDTVEIVRPLASKKDLALNYTVEPGGPAWVIGDDSRLRQILLNLLNNAVKFTEAGSIAVDIRWPTTHGQDRFRFSVTDTGIGVTAAQRPRLFKQFSQADSSVSRRHGGTGLGLAICKRLVELMDGEIGIASEYGAGSTVWFTAKLPASSEFVEAAAPASPPSEAISARARILLVDDTDTTREIGQAYLEFDGHEVVVASNANQAIRLLESGPFDLVLMDVQMPETDGLTATKIIRALGFPIGEIPIIAMTGNVLPHQIRSFLDAGMNDHVGKPIDRSELYKTVRNWLPVSATHYTSPRKNPEQAAPLGWH